MKKIALAMIVKGSDDEAKVLDRCLENMSPYVDAIYITRTQKKGEEQNKAVAKVVKKYKGILSDFEWVNDFSAARNFNFSQVPKEYEYIMWSDADDVWRGLEKLNDTIEANKDTDAFSFWYMYDFDEYKKPSVVHSKTMIVRNDGCVEWAGALHEDFKENRSVKTMFVEGVERMHLTDEERFTVAAARNVEVSGADVEKNPNDPRVYWNYANSLISVGRHEEAIPQFEKFVTVSHSESEKYLANINLGNLYKDMKNERLAEQHFFTAIGMNPQLPDAYLQTGYYFGHVDNWKRAIEYLLLGLMLVNKETYHSIVVFNPRDYDYNPMMALAKGYYNIQRPDLALPMLEGCLQIYPDHEWIKPLVKELKEQTEQMDGVLRIVKELIEIKDEEEVKRRILAIDKKYQSHPMVSGLRNKYFVKNESTGKDIAFYCGMTDHEWNPDIYETKGFGGSEEAVYYLTKELAKLGWNVTVYATVGPDQMERYGVTWRPFWEFNNKDKWDKLIIWRHPKMVDYDLNCKDIYLDLHDVIPKGEFNEKRLEKINKIFVKSQFHRKLFPNVPDEKFVIVPNGLDTSLFKDKPKKDQYLLINTSSADRSLDVLPALFKRVKEQVPEAKLKWAYGWGIFDSAHGAEGRKWKEDTVKALEEAGIDVLGKLNPSEVAELYKKANILAYPTVFDEIDCISVRKGQLAGCLPITSDHAALNDTNAKGIKIHVNEVSTGFAHGMKDKKAQDEWVEAVVKILKEPIGDRSEMIEWAKGYAWDKIATIWNENLCNQKKT